MKNKTTLPQSEFYQGRKAIKKAASKQSKPKLDYDYFDADGNLVFTRIGLSKEYRLRMPNGIEYTGGSYISDRPRPIYNIRGVLNTPQECEIVFVQDESHVKALGRHNIIATTCTIPPGSNLDTVDWSPLQGRNVVLWPINNDDGKATVGVLRTKLQEIGARNVDIVEIPPNIPLNFQPSDAVAQGWSTEKLLDFIAGNPVEDQKAQPEEDTGDAWKPPASATEGRGDESAESSKEPEKKKKKGCFVLEGRHAEEQPDQELILGGLLFKSGLRGLCGESKIGKTDFFLNFSVCMAAGEPFLWYQPARPLRIYLLQVELPSFAIHKRLKALKLDYSTLKKADPNLFITYRKVTILDEKTVNEVADDILEVFPAENPVDIIAIDPLGHVFDGNENNNDEMKNFLEIRLEDLREKVNPEAAIVFSHHTRKIDGEGIDLNPGLAISGAGYLLRYVDGMDVLYKRNRHDKHITVWSMERHAPATPDRKIIKENGLYIELKEEGSERIVNQAYGKKLDAESNRKYDVVLQLIGEEARKGKAYTLNNFAKTFARRLSLGSNQTLTRILHELAAKGHIKFFKNTELYGQPKPKGSKRGLMCIEGMTIGVGDKAVTTPDGDIKTKQVRVYPDEYACPQTGVLLQVENKEVWVYQADPVRSKGSA